MPVELLVANLPPESEEQTVRRLLSEFSGVSAIRLVRGDFPDGRVSYCVVEVRDRSGGERAVRALDGRYCRGRLLSVELREAPARAHVEIARSAAA